VPDGSVGLAGLAHSHSARRQRADHDGHGARGYASATHSSAAEFTPRSRYWATDRAWIGGTNALVA
jgi:hypothetical protein